MGEFNVALVFSHIQERLWRSLYTGGVLMVIGLLVGYLSSSHRNQTLIRADFVFAKELCTTDVCKQAAQTIQENRFLMVDPCDNFYDFICGGWEANHPLLDDGKSRGQFDETERNTDLRVKGILESEDKVDDLVSIKTARKFYRACLASYTKVDLTLQNLVSQLSVWGGWPMTSHNWESDKFDWRKLTVELERSVTDDSPLFEINIRRDPKDTSRFVIQLSTPVSAKICTIMSKIDNPEVVDDFITEPAEKIANFSKTDLPHSFDQDVDDVTDFAKKLCEIFNTPFQIKDNDTYPSTKLIDFQIMSDKLLLRDSSLKLNWKQLLKEYIYGSGVKLRLEDVLVVQSEQILEIIKLIDKTPQRTLANYLLLHKVRWTLEQTKGDLSDRQSQVKSCVEQTRLTFPHAIGYEYVKLYFTEDVKKEATNIVRTTLDSFITDLSENTWMDEPTRSAAVEKAKNMIPVVGYPDWYKNTSQINEMYSEITVGDCHVTNMERATLADIIYHAKLLHKKAGRAIYIQGAAKTNAEYLVTENIIYIPAGILQPPFYVKGRPDALNFGSIVTIIGHEITHAFDFSGSKADKFGNSAWWWSNKSLETYFEKATCFDEQYSNYTIPELQMFTKEKYQHINGMNSLNENLADNGGLQAAFSAFKRYSGHETKNTRLPGIAGYSPEQLFFIGFTSIWCETSTPQRMLTSVLFDEHAPSKYRALISLSNSQDFAEAWDCPLNSVMRPREKCKLW